MMICSVKLVMMICGVAVASMIAAITLETNIRRCTRRMPGAFGIHKKRTQFITNIIKYNKEKE